jgi:DNA-binding HxlR family transcriptional regulator
MLSELFAHKDYVRILHAVRRKPMRFGALQEELGLNPAQVDRAARFLCKGLLIVPRVVPSEKGRLLVEYEIGRRGKAFLDLFKAFRADASRRKAELGESITAELQSFTR